MYLQAVGLSYDEYNREQNERKLLYVAVSFFSAQQSILVFSCEIEILILK